MKIAFCILLSVFCFFPSFAQVEWRYDRTGIYSDETGLLKSWPDKGPELLWHYDGLGDGHSSAAIANEKIYLTGLTNKQGYLYVFDMNGKLLNKKEYGSEWSKSYDGPRGTVTLDDGKIYIVSGMGVLYCFDEKTLNLVWQKDFLNEFGAKNIQWGINESPLIVNEKLILTPGGPVHNVVALNKNTGDLIWSSKGKGNSSAYCSPLYIGDLQVPQVVTMTAKHIIGMDITNGNLLWSYEQTNRWSVHANTPVYGDNQLLCTSGYGKGSVMLRFTNGGRDVEQAWFSSEIDSRIGAMVKVGDYAYGSGDSNKFWFCVNWKTGEIMYKDRSFGIGNVIAADGMLYCYSDKGEIALVKINPKKFELVSKFPITLGTNQHWAHSVIYQGVLFVRHGDALMAYKVK